MIKFHLENNSLLTIAVNIVEKHHSFGEIKTDGKKVLSFKEKPIEKKYSNAGIYILNKSILKYVKNNTKINFDELINFLLKKKIKIHIFPIHESWLDIGIKKDFMKLRKKIHKF